MSSIADFTGKFRAVTNRRQDSSSSKVIKRSRESFVCVPCRKAKLRCDRGRPCSNCLKSNDERICTYHQPSNISANSTSLTAVEKLSHLEFLVKQCIGSQASSESNSSPGSLANATTLDISARQNEKRVVSAVERPQNATYVGSTHWSAVLDDIQELKAVLAHSDAVQLEDNVDDHVTLAEEVIFGSPISYSIEDVISHSLPPKLEVDRFLSKYLQGGTFIVPFIHSYHFQKQYRAFWSEPNKVNPLWLSLLFSICFLASRIQTVVNLHHWSIDSKSQATIFHQAAGQCLVIGEYNRPQQYVVEALTLYAHCKNLRTLNTSRAAGQIFSIAVRMAYEMGYHRDSDSLGSLSVFEGEMRRRLWSVLKQMDLMKSFQLGLPSNICLENCDTKPPRNLHDADFGEMTTTLPLSRPRNELTQLLWFIIKDGQMTAFSKVCKDALSFKEKSQAEVMELDAEIRDMHATVPDILRPSPLSESIAESPFIVVTKVFVEFVYLKSLCVLHRRYMASGNIFSAKACIEAGKRLVSHFVEIYTEFSPGGMLQSERWMLTNYTLNDFLLGVMVLCLAAHIRRGSESWWSAVDGDPKDEISPLLQQSHSICIECSQVSVDAGRVARAISLVLHGSGTSLSLSSSTPGPQIFSASLGGLEHGFQDIALDPSLISPQNGYSFQAEESFDLLDPFSFMGNGFDNIDWTMFNN